MNWRTTIRESDRDAVKVLVESTGFFSAAEIELAVELVAETLERGRDSGYMFMFADRPELRDGIRAYACYGPIPATQSSFDLYWIAVAPGEQRQGLGKSILLQVESAARDQGAMTMYVDTSGRPQYRSTRTFYESMNYSVAAALMDFYGPGDDKIVYSKKLAR